MQVLRDERKRIINKIQWSMRNGSGPDDIYQPKLWWFDLVEFLDKVGECRRTINTYEGGVGKHSTLLAGTTSALSATRQVHEAGIF